MPPDRDDSLPHRIGAYRILGKVGEGGMGVVFEAEQDNPRRVVALKLLHTGSLSAERIHRFEREVRGR